MSVRPITDTLRLLQGGTFLDQCSDTLAQVVKGVEDTGKAGKVTITLDVKKSGAAVSILAKVTDKTPEVAADPDLFWATVEGNFSTENPAQRKLDLQPVGQPSRELRKNDRGFEVGDVLTLRETLHTGRDMAIGSPLVYTGRQFAATVSHVLHGPVYGLDAGWSILSLARGNHAGLCRVLPRAEAERDTGVQVERAPRAGGHRSCHDTGEAAFRAPLGRRAILIEKRESQCQAIAARLAQGDLLTANVGNERAAARP